MPRFPHPASFLLDPTDPMTVPLSQEDGADCPDDCYLLLSPRVPLLSHHAIFVRISEVKTLISLSLSPHTPTELGPRG